MTKQPTLPTLIRGKSVQKENWKMKGCSIKINFLFLLSPAVGGVLSADRRGEHFTHASKTRINFNVP